MPHLKDRSVTFVERIEGSASEGHYLLGQLIACCSERQRQVAFLLTLRYRDCDIARELAITSPRIRQIKKALRANSLKILAAHRFQKLVRAVV